MQGHAPYDTLLDGFEVRTAIASMVTVCIVSFEGISGLQRVRLHHSHAIVVIYSQQMCEYFLQGKS